MSGTQALSENCLSQLRAALCRCQDHYIMTALRFSNCPSRFRHASVFEKRIARHRKNALATIKMTMIGKE
jgi:hypothetical protein